MNPNNEILSRKWLLLKAIEANVWIGRYLKNMNVLLKAELEEQIRKYHSLINKDGIDSSADDDDCKGCSCKNSQGLHNKCQYHIPPRNISTSTSSTVDSAYDGHDSACGGSSSSNDQMLHIKSENHISDDVDTSANTTMVTANCSASDDHDGDCERSSSSNDQVLRIKSENDNFHEDMSMDDNTMVATDFSVSFGDDGDNEGSSSSNDQVLHKKIKKPFFHDDMSTSTNSTMTAIGPHTNVRKSVLKSINWNSHTNATRKILMDVFPRRVLATHSLTGKPSPAFPGKPTKKMLDPNLVNDIVKYVVKRCPGATISAVRTIVRIKCADEARMMRNQKKKYTNYRQRSSTQSYSDVSSSSSINETIWPKYF